MEEAAQVRRAQAEHSQTFLAELFGHMATGGFYAFEDILEFDGGLFDGRPPLALEFGEIGLLFAAASLDWSLIDPTIFGTLFERFLDPDKRAQIGAHYTDRQDHDDRRAGRAAPAQGGMGDVRAEIETIMAPALNAPAAKRQGASAAVKKRSRRRGRRRKPSATPSSIGSAACAFSIRPAAPAISSIWLAGREGYRMARYPRLPDARPGLCVPRVGPEILHGIEINPFAAELARTTIWIGDIQWRVKNAVFHHPSPMLRKLDSIECRDALIAPDGRGGFVEAEWPEADFIIGNPPFLGGKLMRRGLGDATVETLFSVYDGRVPAEADLVCYWFAKAWQAVQAGRAKRVGLVATNSIRGGANRKVLEPIAEAGAIFEAWSDEPWTIDGAAVRVSAGVLWRRTRAESVQVELISRLRRSRRRGNSSRIGRV